eukprot:Sdes_comp19998_c0_seq1m12635
MAFCLRQFSLVPRPVHSFASFRNSKQKLSFGNFRTLKYLVAVDGSSISCKALDYTLKLMKPQDKIFVVSAAAKLEASDILHGIYDPIRATANLKPDTKNAIHKVNETYKEHAKQILNNYHQKLTQSGYQFECSVHQGTARAVILSCADKHKVDFVVLGSRGLNALQRFD